MSRWVSKLTVPLIILIVLAAIAAPILFAGYQAEARAKAASEQKNYALAGEDYESAARLLPWRLELKEKAALAYASARAWERAMPLFEAASQQGGLSADGWDVFGTGYWIAGQDQQALDAWSTGLRHYPTEAKFHSRLALVYRDFHDYASERKALDLWINTGQGSALEHYELGTLLLGSEPSRAREKLAKAAAIDSAFAPAAQTLQASQDLAARESNGAQKRVILGRGLALVNEWWLAKQAFEEATSTDPKNAEAWAWLGEAHQQTGKDGKSELDKALSLDAHDTLVHALRGLYWKRQGKYAAELAEYRRAAQLEPDNPQWQVALGDAYTLSGDLVSALAAYQKATSLAPTKAVYWRLLALFCADSGVQVTNIGLPAARKAVQLAPEDSQAQDALGWSFAQAGLLYNAEQTLIKATHLDPGSALPHLHLGETYLRKGDQTAALRELTAARQLDPDGTAGALADKLMRQYFP
jgi:tetratricopeptide (TPR) repeat protein